MRSTTIPGQCHVHVGPAALVMATNRAVLVPAPPTCHMLILLHHHHCLVIAGAWVSSGHSPSSTGCARRLCCCTRFRRGPVMRTACTGHTRRDVRAHIDNKTWCTSMMTTSYPTVHRNTPLYHTYTMQEVDSRAAADSRCNQSSKWYAVHMQLCMHVHTMAGAQRPVARCIHAAQLYPVRTAWGAGRSAWPPPASEVRARRSCAAAACAQDMPPCGDAPSPHAPCPAVWHACMTCV